MWMHGPGVCGRDHGEGWKRGRQCVSEEDFGGHPVDGVFVGRRFIFVGQSAAAGGSGNSRAIGAGASIKSGLKRLKAGQVLHSGGKEALITETQAGAVHTKVHPAPGGSHDSSGSSSESEFCKSGPRRAK